MSRSSPFRIVALVIAVCSLAWMVANVNTHGDEVRGGVSSFLKVQAVQTRAQQSLVRERESSMAGGGLDLVDMYQCTWGSPGSDIRGWVGLWLVTMLIGGVPTAVFVHAESRRRT